jgi:alpha-beta hydrolase superfamily lysophospholipase
MILAQISASVSAKHIIVRNRTFRRSSSCVRLCFASLSIAILGAEMSASGQTAPALQRLSVQVNGHTFAVWARVPAGPRGAVLLLHGRTWSSLPDFDLQVPGLNRSVLVSLAAKGFAAYALDQRGYGETPRDATGWITPRQAAADAAGVLAWIAARHPQLPRPALLGWSLGAATAHLVAASSPTDLSAVILYGYAPDPDGVIASVVEPAAPAREKNTREAAASDFVSPRLTDPSVVKAFVEMAVRTDPVHVDWKDEEQFICDSSRIRVPTLMLFGDRDANVDAQSQKRFFRRLATKEKATVSFPGADHCAHLEATHDAWIAAVVNFLNRPGVLTRYSSSSGDFSPGWGRQGGVHSAHYPNRATFYASLPQFAERPR